MNWEAISAIGQIVGAFAVVISLIYLAREIRSNAHAARLASMDTLNRWLGELVVHPHLGELYYRGIRDFESLEDADLIGFSVLMVEAFRLYEEVYSQRLEGQLGPRLWRGFEAGMRDLNAYPGVQGWWRVRSQYFNKEFANYINQLQQTAKPPRYIRKPVEDQ